MSLQFFTSLLAQAMLGAVKASPWLFLLDAFMIVSALFAFVTLSYAEKRLTPEQARLLIWEDQQNSYRRIHRYVVRACRFLLGFGVVSGLIWFGLLFTAKMTSQGNELFVGVLFGGVLLPTYFTLKILGRAVGKMAERLEHLTRPSKPSSD